MGSFRNIVRAGVSALFIIALGATHATAQVIFNTGVNSSGGVLPHNSIDPHYTITPGSQAIVKSGLHATPGSNTTSEWIQVNTDFGPGSYVWSTNFTWPTAETITITGQWAADVQGLDIRLNGVSDGDSIPNPAYTQWHPFSITGLATAGPSNVLDFQTFRGDQPTALRVEIFSVVPEPTTAGMLFSLGLIALRRRR